MHPLLRRGLAVGAAGLLSVSVFGVQQAVARADVKATGAPVAPGAPGATLVDSTCVARDSLAVRNWETHWVDGRWVVDKVTVAGDFSACRDGQNVEVQAFGENEMPLAGGRSQVVDLSPQASVDIAMDKPLIAQQLSAIRVTVHG